MDRFDDELYRIETEVKEAIKKAGGNVTSFATDKIAHFLFCCQCNSIEIWKLWPEGKPGRIHVTYQPTIQYEQKENV